MADTKGRGAAFSGHERGRGKVGKCRFYGGMHDVLLYCFCSCSQGAKDVHSKDEEDASSKVLPLERRKRRARGKRGTNSKAGGGGEVALEKGKEIPEDQDCGCEKNEDDGKVYWSTTL